MRFGPPIDFSRYYGLETDRFVLRAVTDEIIYEIMKLSGQEYVDQYAQAYKSARQASQRHASRRGHSRDEAPEDAAAGPGEAAVVVDHAVPADHAVPEAGSSAQDGPGELGDGDMASTVNGSSPGQVESQGGSVPADPGSESGAAGREPDSPAREAGSL